MVPKLGTAVRGTVKLKNKSAKIKIGESPRRYKYFKFFIFNFDFLVSRAALVEERSLCAEVLGASRNGAQRSENAGMSSKNQGENPWRRKSKVSWATRIAPGLVEPKARPQGVADGRAG